MHKSLDIQVFRERVRNILLIRTDRIGDVILTLPVVDILKHYLPDSRIDFLVNKRVSELISDYPNINKVHPIEKERLRDIMRICKEGNYDLAIVARPLFVIALSLYLVGIRYRLGTGYRWYSFLFNLRHYQHRKDSVKHELEYNTDLLSELGIEVNEYPSPKLRVSEEVINTVKQKLLQKEIDPDKKFIIIHPSTLGSALAWSPENFVKLIQLLSADKEFNYGIIITGEESERLLPLSFGKGSGVRYILDFNLKELAALIYLSRLFIGNSTGPIHIATAVGTFAVGIYSPLRTESPVRWAPYTHKKKIFMPDLPGFKNPEGVKNTEHSGIMDSIKPVEVYRFVKSYLDSSDS